SAAPEPKTATVERREASVLRRTQGASPAPGLPRNVQAQRVPRKHPYDSRRSAHPFRGCVKRKKQNPGVKNAPRERERLFEIVKKDALLILIPRARQSRAFWPNGQTRAQIAPRARSTSSAMRWPSFAAGIPQ